MSVDDVTFINCGLPKPRNCLPGEFQCKRQFCVSPDRVSFLLMMVKMTMMMITIKITISVAITIRITVTITMTIIPHLTYHTYPHLNLLYPTLTHPVFSSLYSRFIADTTFELFLRLSELPLQHSIYGTLSYFAFPPPTTNRS